MSGRIRVDFTEENTFMVRFLTENGESIDAYEVGADRLELTTSAYNRIIRLNTLEEIYERSGKVN
jgi:hypothetical protein